MNELTTATAIEMIHAAALRIDEATSELSRLDAVAGDGDHGVNMAAAFHAAEADFVADPPNSAADVFAGVGRSFSDGAGGSAGALFGAIFGALGNRLRRSTPPSVSDFVDGLELGTTRVAVIGRTAPGSKTMLDALTPAVEAAQAAANAGRGLADVMTAAAAASERGAAATAGMRATAGRARHAQDGAVGTKDPGAVTVSVIFGAWADACTQRIGS